MNEADKVSIHVVLEMFASGQLLFLGLVKAEVNIYTAHAYLRWYGHAVTANKSLYN